MPTIKFPKNPNVDTAFVEQDDGTKNRALMIAPQDISTLELPNNPNSTKGYITVDGQKQRVILTADITGGGGGSSLPDQTGHSGEFLTTDGTDASWAGAVPQYSTMPTASASNMDNLGQYIGMTDATYTNGFFYKNKRTATYSGSVTFAAATVSGATTTWADADFIAWLETQTLVPETVTSGTLEAIDEYGDEIQVIGKDANNNVVFTNTVEFWNLMNAGAQFSTYQLTQGDIVAFTCSITVTSATYAWTQTDVQTGFPDQTGQSGKFLRTDGSDVYWDSALTNSTGKTGSVNILGNISNYNYETILGQLAQASGNNSVSVGYYARSTTNSVAIGSSVTVIHANAVAVGYNASVTSNLSVAIGSNASASNNSVAVGYNSSASQFYTVAIGGSANATGAIQIGGGTNTDAGTLQIGLYQGSGLGVTLYRLLNKNGTIPTDRLTKVNTTVTLTSADWSGGSQTVTVTGMTATGVVLVSPDPTDQAAYTSAGILCTAQAADSLTFTCSTTPSADIDVNVVCL